MKRLTVNLDDATNADLTRLTSLTPKRSKSEEAAIAIEAHIERNRLALKRAPKLKAQ